MNLKIANLIAIQFGITIGTMFWLAYTHFPPAVPRAETELRESAAPAAPAFETVDDRADREPPPPIPEEPTLATQNDDLQVAAEPYPANSVPVDNSISRDLQSYARANLEPAAVQYESVPQPQTVEYSQPIEAVEYIQPVQTVVYAQPTQIVVFSNPRPFVNRCRPAPHLNTGVQAGVTPRGHGGGRGPGVRGPAPIAPTMCPGPRVVPRQNPNPRPLQLTEGKKNRQTP